MGPLVLLQGAALPALNATGVQFGSAPVRATRAKWGCAARGCPSATGDTTPPVTRVHACCAASADRRMPLWAAASPRRLQAGKGLLLLLHALLPPPLLPLPPSSLLLLPLMLPL